MTLQNYMKLFQDPTTGLGVPAVEGVIGLYDDGNNSHLYVKLTGPHKDWRYVKSWASKSEDEDITKIAEELISGQEAGNQIETKATLSSNAYITQIAEAKTRTATVIFNAGTTVDLQNAINALTINQVLEIQTNDTYGSLLIPVRENIVIRAGTGFLPVFTDVNAIRIQNGSKNIFLMGLSFLNCTTANANTKGSAICFEAQGTIVDGLFIVDCNFELCAGSGILLTYHHTSYTANFTLLQLSKNIAIVDGNFLRACSDATEGGAICIRGINGLYILRCTVDAGDGSVVWAGENKTRGIHVQASINIEIDNCMAKNGNDPTANGEGFKFNMLSPATATFKTQGMIKNSVAYNTKQGFDADDQANMKAVNCKAVNVSDEGFLAQKLTSEGSFESCLSYNCDTGFRVCGPVPAVAILLSNNLCIQSTTDDYCMDNGDVLPDNNKTGARALFYNYLKNEQAIISNVTYTVKASGGDFATIQLALNSLKSKRINPDVTVTISVDSGLFTHSSTIIFNHPDGDRIKIVGATPISTAITSLDSQTGGAGNYSVILNITSSAGMAVGDYAIINSSTGTGEYRSIMGCWEITEIPSPTQIKVKNTYRKAAWPAMTITGGNVKCLKTILKFNNCDGFQFGSASGKIYNVAIVGNGTAYDGVNVSQRGIYFGNKVIYLGDGSNYSIGINGFGRYGIANTSQSDLWAIYIGISNCGNYGVYAYSNARITARDIISSGNGNIGIYAADGAWITCTYSYAIGNSTSGFYAYNRAGINAQYSEAVGNIYSGFQANACSLLDNRNGKALNNAYHGYSCNSGSTIYASSSSAVGNGAAVNYYGYYCINNSVIRADSSTGSGNFSGDYRAENYGFIRVTNYTGAPTFSPALEIIDNGGALIKSNDATVVEIKNNSNILGTTIKDALNTLTDFVSTEQTGNGGAQSVAHGLGRIPGKVLIVVTDSALGPFTITEGVHDATNVVVTVTNNVKYKVYAK